MHQVIIDPGVFHQAAASQLFAGFADLLAPLLHAGGIRSAHEAVARADENSRSPKLRCVSRKTPWPSAILQFPISARNSASSASLSTDMSVPKASSETMESMFSDLRRNSFLFAS